MSSPARPAVPALDPAEVRRCIEMLEAIDKDRTLLASIDRDEMVALLTIAGRVAVPDRNNEARLTKAIRRKRSAEERAKDKALRDADRVTRSKTEIRTLRKEVVFSAPLLPANIPDQQQPERVLEKPEYCYVCKTQFKTLHFFYDTMCKACGDFNYAKRFQTANLRGKVALITGGRVKIGYQASLMLLRAGARVIATTRFPNDAAERYAKEADFNDWAARLQIHALDLRHAPSVELFARHIAATHDRLDILINNAAQTVRRPPGFYAHLLPSEQRGVHELDPKAQILLGEHAQFVEQLTGARSLGAGSATIQHAWQHRDLSAGIHSSAALSQIPYALEEQGEVEKLFPAGKLDADLQQVDLREMNSWRMRLAEVVTGEMLEVHLVNAVAPFILCGKLKPLMMKDRKSAGHIVNVSAMEGSFSRGTKTDNHPHTNMAKAALNMMTLTSAPDYARDNIYMNAVDTGWVTDEDPIQHAQRKIEEHDFQPPLDIVDGAARIVDPVFASENEGKYGWGIFYKDYKPTPW
jgi:NAD(P)-dependent dehydrogenase (short-subunit alcohol dehydrogenase family)